MRDLNTNKLHIFNELCLITTNILLFCWNLSVLLKWRKIFVYLAIVFLENLWVFRKRACGASTNHINKTKSWNARENPPLLASLKGQNMHIFGILRWLSSLQICSPIRVTKSWNPEHPGYLSNTFHFIQIEEYHVFLSNLSKIHKFLKVHLSSAMLYSLNLLQRQDWVGA